MPIKLFPVSPVALVHAIILVFAGWSGFASSTEAQSLVERYRAARFKAQANQVLDGFHADPASAVRLEYPTDSLREWVRRAFPPEEIPQEPVEPKLTVTRWELVPKLGRDWFRKKFDEIRWTYLGSNSIHTLDTTFTRDLRARLQESFGSPTQTIADLDHSTERRTREYVQFEYWFVLNGAIPLKVMDVNGPFERGLVVASSHEYRDVLSEIKEVFLRQLVDSEERAAYVDYYHLPEQQLWFLTGYDGEKYFIDRIGRPDLKLGRPLLKSERD